MVIKNIKFTRQIYNSNDYVIGLYTASKLVEVPGELPTKTIICKGTKLPTNKDREFTFTGEFVFEKDKNNNPRISFVVSSFEEVLPHDKDGIVKYLTTLRGIGKVTAPRIYELIYAWSVSKEIPFFDALDDILENEPEELLRVRGVREKALGKIKESYIERTAGKELFAYLSCPPFNVSPSIIYKIYDKYKADSLEVVKTSPYELTHISGIGFLTADKIAKINDIPLDCVERLEAGIFELLLENENGGSLINKLNKGHANRYTTGNTCIGWEDLYVMINDALDVNLSPHQTAVILNDMRKAGIVDIIDNKYFALASTSYHEKGIARDIARLSSILPTKAIKPFDAEFFVQSEVSIGKLNTKLSGEQINAVVNSLNNCLSIVTGGPGTGKTTIQKTIIGMYKILWPDRNILLCAPTGRAARKMSESTGLPAMTMHQALGLNAYEGDNSGFVCNNLDYGLILVDEFSMVDTNLAYYFFKNIPKGTQVVMIGDVKQLPSVGPGSVLRECIDSKTISVSELTQVYRQAGNSSISYNAKRIDKGECKMDEDDSFVFVEKENSREIVDCITELYTDLTNEYGIEETSILSPFRNSTITGTNQLNITLRKLAHPDIEELPSNSFIVGDRVMFTKNEKGLSNGDIGTVTSVSTEDGLTELSVDFSDGRIVDFSDDEIAGLEFAYATTVHKSQGSEYKVVILVIDKAHQILLRRNLVYTGITRAKSKVYIVGQRDMFNLAVSREDTTQRLSLLSTHLKKVFKNQNAADKEVQLQM